VFSLVSRQGLPIDGLREHLTRTLVARRAGVVVGSAAIGLYEDGALLRSVLSFFVCVDRVDCCISAQNRLVVRVDERGDVREGKSLAQK